jgi:outer membrane lipoprotein carrier protein
MKFSLLIGTALIAACGSTFADSVDTLREFVRDVKTGKANFTQVVTSPDGAKKKTSSGTFAFSRPNRFRFAYSKPFEQLIVADGEKVWIYDTDLNQVSSRTIDNALGATPAALLAGGSLDQDFTLSAQPSKDGVDWAEAKPKAKDGSFQLLRVGFKGKELAALEIVDSFGQRSLMQFSGVAQGIPLPPEDFVFKPPPGADVLKQ